jgi:hypothetical protein
MSLYVFGESMAQFCGLMVHLVAHHRELTPCSALTALSEDGVRAATRHDSCGVWIVGGIYQVLQLSTGTRAIYGSMHPALMTESGGTGRFKAFTRGFPMGSYKKPSEADTSYHRACEVPSDTDLVKVMHLWAAHELVRVQDGQYRWDMDLPATTDERWEAVAVCLPKTGEALQALS